MTSHDTPARRSKPGRVAHVALMGGTLVGAAVRFSPFFSPILWAVVLTYALYPLYGRVLRVLRGRAGLSAFLMCVVITIGFLIPLLYLALLVAQDMAGTLSALLACLEGEEGSFEAFGRRFPVIAGFVEQLQNLERLTGTNLRSSLVEGVADLGKLLIQQSTKMVRNLLQGMIEFSIVL